jgi:hypothetical protein
MLSPTLPDLLSELAAAVGRRLVDQVDGVGNGHLIGLAFHARDGGEPFAQGCCALAWGVVLAGEATDSGMAECVGAEDVAASAGPDEVLRIAVLFMAVQVTDFNVAR